MVTLNARQSANEIQDVLEDRRVKGLGTIAFSAAGGVVLAQEVADRILPAIGFNRNPNTASGFFASAATKAALALGFGIASASMSGVGLVVAAYAGIGALAGAGADLLNAVQRSGLAAEAPTRQRSRQQTSTSSSSSSGGGGAAYEVTA